MNKKWLEGLFSLSIYALVLVFVATGFWSIWFSQSQSTLNDFTQKYQVRLKSFLQGSEGRFELWYEQLLAAKLVESVQLYESLVGNVEGQKIQRGLIYRSLYPLVQSKAFGPVIDLVIYDQYGDVILNLHNLVRQEKSMGESLGQLPNKTIDEFTREGGDLIYRQWRPLENNGQRLGWLRIGLSAHELISTAVKEAKEAEYLFVLKTPQQILDKRLAYENVLSDQSGQMWAYPHMSTEYVANLNALLRSPNPAGNQVHTYLAVNQRVWQVWLFFPLFNYQQQLEGGFVVFSDALDLKNQFITLVVSAVMLLMLLWASVFQWRRSLVSKKLKRLKDEENEELLFALDHLPVAVSITNEQGVIEYVNRTHQKITGYSREESIGGDHRMIQSGRTPSKIYEEMWQTISSGKPWQGELIDKNKNGHYFWANLRVTPIDQLQQRKYLGVLEDISAEKQAREKLNSLAYSDTLTGLDNRMRFREAVEHFLAQVKRVTNLSGAFLLLDLDGFKSVNDSLGHEAGDHLLVILADRLRQRLRISDHIGRLGGDEFGICITTPSSADQLFHLASELIEVVQQSVMVKDHPVTVGCSIGVALIPQDGDTYSELFRNADLSMYAAKRGGKGRVHFFDPHLVEVSQRHLWLLENLRVALKQSQELQLYYQPKVDIASGHILGAEALLRWLHPVEGFIPPMQFIPVAEEDGLIREVGSWVLERVVLDLPYILETMPDFKLSFNVSAEQLFDEHFIQRLRQLSQECLLPIEHLELEVTETAIMTEEANAIEILDELRGLGYSLSIDDFGTGQSSLARLKCLPVQTLKVDKSFVQDMHEDANDFDLVRIIMELSSLYKMNVVAEGVELMEHKDLLQGLNCKIGQGYLWHKPMPLPELIGLLEAQSQGAGVYEH